MELVRLLSDYPPVTLLFVIWPLLFVWLLVWTMRKSSEREERLMAANDRWQVAVQELTKEIKGIVASVVEKVREEILKELRR